MVREDNFDGIDRAHKNWRRMDIGIDWPFDQLPPGDVERFPYAVLEVKLQTQMGQEPPAWVRELVSSHLVEAVPKFSKFIHGCATLLPDKVQLIPFWLPQMGVDIRKEPRSSFGVERPQLAESSLSEVEYTSQYADEEDAIESGRTVVRFDNAATQRNREEADEHTPLLPNGGSSHAGNHDTHGASDLVSKALAPVNFFIEWFKEQFLNEVSISNLPPGTVFISDIKVPEGKTLCVPVRIEPKVYFANERTFLAWLEIGILLGAIAGTMLNFGSSLAIEAAVGFFAVAVLTILYAICLYIWRLIMIRRKSAVRYDDRFGPTAICIALAAATGLNFFLQYSRT
jgi:uncharacterized membrane protein YidH (DUF202 family)